MEKIAEGAFNFSRLASDVEEALFRSMKENGFVEPDCSLVFFLNSGIGNKLNAFLNQAAVDAATA
jgi:hypothetical protein